MKIVVTDGYPLNPGDVNWDSISALGELQVYDRSSPSELPERCKGAEIVLTNKTPISADLIGALPDLKFISVLATGFNIVDTVAARKHGVIVSNVPGYGTASVAQHVFALLLELTNHVGINANAVASGKWVNSEDFCFTEAPLMELAEKTMGIVGYGNIGQQVGRIALALGMKVIYSGPRDKHLGAATYKSMEDLFRESDVISLHSPLTSDNQEFVNASLISTMQKSAILINTARGQLINEQELADALNDGVIKAAALDVLSKEPPPASNPLLTAKNCLLSPHVAWISFEARLRIMSMTAENIKAYSDGKPVNVVN